MSKLGKQLIRDLKWFKGAIRDGTPVRQSVVRRMKVKGKTVYIHDRFTAPITENRAR